MEDRIKELDKIIERSIPLSSCPTKKETELWQRRYLKSKTLQWFEKWRTLAKDEPNNRGHDSMGTERR